MIKKPKPYLNPEMFSIFIIKIKQNKNQPTNPERVIHITGNPLK